MAASFLLIWVNLAVAMIGSKNNAANLMYGGVLAIAVIGAALRRFQPAGMACTLSAPARILVGIIAQAAFFGSTAAGAFHAVLFATGFLTALWLLAAHLFRMAMRDRSGGRSVVT